jgi:Uma2 family endonuclease
LEDLAHRPGVRITYDRGRLQAVSPLREHEYYAQVLSDIVDIVAEEMGVLTDPGGSTTFKNRSRLSGVEPDRCFYVANASRLIGKLTIDPETDPPPDIVIEVDMSSDSPGKFPIYADLGVPEIWRYDATRAEIWLLNDSRAYRQASASKSFPILTPAVLEEFLEISRTKGRTVAPPDLHSLDPKSKQPRVRAFRLTRSDHRQTVAED